jgi:cell division protein FtsZ
MTLSEVEILMKELGRHVSDQTQILFGTAVDGRMGNRLSVTIISSLGADVDLAMENATAARSQTPSLASTAASPPASNTLSQPSPPEIEVASPGGAESDPDSELAPVETIPPVDLIPFEPPAPLESIPPDPPLTLSKSPVIVAAEVHVSQPDKPRLILPKKKPAPIKETTPAPEKVQAKQEVLQFEPVTRGRFEKSEPTIIEGQDLDVPTFLRKNIRVK